MSLIFDWWDWKWSFEREHGGSSLAGKALQGCEEEEDKNQAEQGKPYTAQAEPEGLLDLGLPLSRASWAIGLGWPSCMSARSTEFCLGWVSKVSIPFMKKDF